MAVVIIRAGKKTTGRITHPAFDPLPDVGREAVLRVRRRPAGQQQGGDARRCRGGRDLAQAADFVGDQIQHESLAEAGRTVEEVNARFAAVAGGVLGREDVGVDVGDDLVVEETVLRCEHRFASTNAVRSQFRVLGRVEPSAALLLDDLVASRSIRGRRDAEVCQRLVIGLEICLESS
jgi:hypothetical protein